MNIAVLTSGGDAPGMNAAVRAVVRSAGSLGHHVYGVKDGYKGLIEDDLVLLDHQSVSGMLSTGGTFLGTARVPEFHELEYQKKAIENLKKETLKL